MKSDADKDIVVAFINQGHPRLAFAVVALKTVPRILLAGSLATGVALAAVQGGEGLVKALTPVIMKVLSN